MKIKDLKINGKTFLAPLAGITNLPFRLLVKECGCAVVCSEMISAKGIFYNSEKTLGLLTSKKQEKPLSVQLFGSDPDSMAKGAKVVENLNIASIIDINFGCSVKKIIKQGAGSALMRDPKLSTKILRAVRKATDLPMTIKLRSGWDTSGQQAFDIARIAQDLGVNAVIMHPRTAKQGFKGKADWHLIKNLKQKLAIPVIGNGDINTVEDAQEMITLTGCDAVMVGRAAMKNPFILSQIEDFFETGSYQTPSNYKIFRTMERLTEMYVAYFGEIPACKMLRSRLSWFVKGMPGCSALRAELSSTHSKNHILAIIKEFESCTA
ncbi:MAG: tRNA dihydrouridine synthase DusB [Desulfobacula sp.]|jgi:tRNA-dihydrouridine synthase B|uniref:tRNA dihydrouridine synthase DusB n=1 Tax=Desulfobacula sp. TaxID=2593537 RepID=UPI001DDDA517|nr:tRNA dihydrouridine synthase DusB [Desulfobacula sp.]MBT3485014.1 tRNA dihydrouridine synthase DusB [Desulfobacula sp.]MBT3804169.1 tRNA dihydrouridine synthase DusB [Desulfobacula sp.]MBT4025025.1 tRNA dihydrouridine synthase DusB [Desulfobacula sp.]MBT4198665.1 tRNA dihydrouridine synthase DusB [Desulfobacula sp.]